MEINSDKNISASLSLNGHLSLVADENKLNEPRIANEPRAAREAQHSELLRRVGDDLRRLAMSEACLVRSHIAHCLDGNERDPLPFHEAVESPLRNQWIDTVRRLEEHY